jgi:hypothetical protein
MTVRDLWEAGRNTGHVPEEFDAWGDDVTRVADQVDGLVPDPTSEPDGRILHTASGGLTYTDNPVGATLEQYGGRANCVSVNTGLSWTNGGTSITSTDPIFTGIEVGDVVAVMDSPTSWDSPVFRTVASVTAPTQLVVNTGMPSTVGNGAGSFGTDNGPAMQAALNASQLSGIGSIRFGSGRYLFHTSVAHYAQWWHRTADFRLEGAGAGTHVVICPGNNFFEAGLWAWVNCRSVRVHNLTFYCGPGPAPWRGVNALDARLTVTDCTFYNVGCVASGGGFLFANSLWLRNCLAYGSRLPSPSAGQSQAAGGALAHAQGQLVVSDFEATDHGAYIVTINGSGGAAWFRTLGGSEDQQIHGGTYCYLDNVRTDEATNAQLIVSGSKHVRLRNVRHNAPGHTGFPGFWFENCETVDIDYSMVRGWGPLTDALRATTVHHLTLRRCVYTHELANRVTVSGVDVMEVHDSAFSTLSGTPNALVESDRGIWKEGSGPLLGEGSARYVVTMASGTLVATQLT